MRLIPQEKLYVCPQCGSKDVTKRGSINRIIKTLSIACREDIYFDVKVPRLSCKSCGGLHYMPINFADERKSYSRQLALYVILLFSHMTISSIAKLVGLHWHTVKEITKSFLMKKYSKPDLRNLKRISIDEISIGKGHQYLTVVINAETGTPIYVGDGKGESALDEFWKLLGKRRSNRIEAVAIDMGKAYIAAVKKNLPKALIVFDHFHVVKLVNQTLDLLRRKEMARASVEEQDVIKGTKYILLANEEDLTESKRKRLEKLLDLNNILSSGYILKEDIRQIWKKKNIDQAEKSINSWIETAKSTNEPLLIKLAKTIDKHREGILNWYIFPINSGRIEGINTKIKAMIRQAYGYRDKKYLKLLILAILHGRIRMVVDHKT
jgi:transposase